MAELVAIGDRAWVSPDHIKFVGWRPARDAFKDWATGELMRATVTVETYHATYNIPFATVLEAQTEAQRIVLACTAFSAAPVKTATRLNLREAS